jgi:hypothetical protein
MGEIVIPFASQFSGIKGLYDTEYVFTHTRVSLSDRAGRDGYITVEILDQIIRDAFEHKIFIDDCDTFQDESILTEFIRKVRQAGKINLVGIKITTEGGVLQNIWAHSFFTAENRKRYVSIKDHMHLQDSDFSPDPKIFDQFLTKPVHLYINKRSMYCNHQGLLLDWECLYIGGILRNRLESFFKSWLNHRSLGRIIVFVPQEKLKTVLEDIVKLNFDFPLYYFAYSKNCDDFATPPCPGVIAYAQYLHNLNLSESVYVCTSTPLLSQNIGFGYV